LITPSAQSAIEATLANYDGKIDVKFKYAFKGFVAELPISMLPFIRKIPTILSVEADALRVRSLSRLAVITAY